MNDQEPRPKPRLFDYCIPCLRVTNLFKKRSLTPSAAKVGDDYQAVVVTALHGIPIDASYESQDRLRSGISHLNVSGLHCFD